MASVARCSHLQQQQQQRRGSLGSALPPPPCRILSRGPPRRATLRLHGPVCRAVRPSSFGDLASADDDDDDEQLEEELLEEEIEEELAEEEEEEIEEIVEMQVEAEPLSVDTVTTAVVQHVPTLIQRPVVKNTLFCVGAVLVGTFVYSVYKVYQKYNTPRSRRKRNVNTNRALIDTINQYLPEKRGKFDRGVLRGIQWQSSFTHDLIFRKYLRYLLDQREFNTDAVSDVLTLRATCQITDEQVKEVIVESAKRCFERTGILMRNPVGMTAEGMSKKASGQALFSKLMYLVDIPELTPTIPSEDLQLAIMEEFGATSEDFEALRISSLTEADTADLERLMGRGPDATLSPVSSSFDEEEEEGDVSQEQGDESKTDGPEKKKEE